MAGEALIGLGIGIVLVWIFLVLAIVGIAIWAFVFWILMIVNCAQRKFKNDTDKIVWILLIIFLHILGALIYYFVVKRKK